MDLRGINDIGATIDAAVEAIAPGLIEVRRDIHAHPEIGFEVQRTAGVVAAELDKLDIPYRTGIGRTGIVAEIEGGAPGPCLLIRADMDALPIQEMTGLPFASTVPGAMHACGHDIHTATLIGVGAVLQQLAPRLRGRIRLVFQPAEETPESGAAAMILDGAADGADMALAFHNSPTMPVGRFGYIHGASTASADTFDITVRGRSGHAARPQDAADPIVAAAYLVTQLQTVVSRSIDPAQGAVVTVGSIAGGATHNIIPDTCTLRGTVRARSPEARTVAETTIRRIVQGIELTQGVTCELDYQLGVPPLMNDPRMLEASVAAVRAQFGEVVDETAPGFGAEDFAFFSERVPSFHLRVGAGQPGRNDHLHNSDYQPDERCIALGAAALVRSAVELLS
ncbi:M20 metallopeptidase family protein [Inquilinus limosus]|uniref:M20 metallopeptidase family protein n=1 Tax=Inquilinus limosus TaxID=171674 RepID=UPI000478FE10|nr:amidohydrolase [Inquilinus limosus]